MRVCSNCKTEIPAEYGGASCPACKTRLPAVTSRRTAALTPLTGAAIEQAAAAARARGPSDSPPAVRPASVRPASQRAAAEEDRWDLPPDEAALVTPEIPPPPGVPTGFGRPGTSASAGVGAKPGADGAVVAPGPRPASSTLVLGRVSAAEAAQMLTAAPTLTKPAPSRADETAPHAAARIEPPRGVSTAAGANGNSASSHPPRAGDSTPPASAGRPRSSVRPASQTLVMAGVAAPAAPGPNGAAVPAAGVPPVPGPRAPSATLVGTAPTLPAARAPSATVVGTAPAIPVARPASATLVGTAPVAPPVAAGASVAPGSDGLRPASTVVGYAAPAAEPASPALPPASPASRAASPAPEPARPAAPPAPRSATTSADATGARPGATSSTPPVTATQRQRPVLASEVLREDLVPHEPGARAARVVLAVAGATLVALAAQQGVGSVHSLAAWGIPGVTALLVGLAPVSYGTRALLAMAPALPALTVQALGAPGASATGALLLTAVCASLPASLLFRANFRASRRARVFVAAALACALAWALHPSGGALLSSAPAGQAWALARLPGASLFAIVLLSLTAFMGNNTTGACRAWAAMVVVWSALAAAPPAAMAAADLGTRAAGAALATGIASLCAVLAVSVAGLLAEYARPSEPRTGIGLAASPSGGEPRSAKK